MKILLSKEYWYVVPVDRYNVVTQNIVILRCIDFFPTPTNSTVKESTKLRFRGSYTDKDQDTLIKELAVRNAFENYFDNRQEANMPDFA